MATPRKRQSSPSLMGNEGQVDTLAQQRAGNQPGAQWGYANRGPEADSGIGWQAPWQPSLNFAGLRNTTPEQPAPTLAPIAQTGNRAGQRPTFGSARTPANNYTGIDWNTSREGQPAMSTWQMAGQTGVSPDVIARQNAMGASLGNQATLADVVRAREDRQRATLASRQPSVTAKAAERADMRTARMNRMTPQQLYQTRLQASLLQPGGQGVMGGQLDPDISQLVKLGYATGNQQLVGLAAQMAMSKMRESGENQRTDKQLATTERISDKRDTGETTRAKLHTDTQRAIADKELQVRRDLDASRERLTLAIQSNDHTAAAAARADEARLKTELGQLQSKTEVQVAGVHAAGDIRRTDAALAGGDAEYDAQRTTRILGRMKATGFVEGTPQWSQELARQMQIDPYMPPSSRMPATPSLVNPGGQSPMPSAQSDGPTDGIMPQPVGTPPAPTVQPGGQPTATQPAPTATLQPQQPTPAPATGATASIVSQPAAQPQPPQPAPQQSGIDPRDPLAGMLNQLPQKQPQEGWLNTLDKYAGYGLAGGLGAPFAYNAARTYGPSLVKSISNAYRSTGYPIENVEAAKGFRNVMGQVAKASKGRTPTPRVAPSLKPTAAAAKATASASESSAASILDDWLRGGPITAMPPTSEAVTSLDAMASPVTNAGKRLAKNIAPRVVDTMEGQVSKNAMKRILKGVGSNLGMAGRASLKALPFAIGALASTPAMALDETLGNGVSRLGNNDVTTTTDRMPKKEVEQESQYLHSQGFHRYPNEDAYSHLNRWEMEQKRRGASLYQAEQERSPWQERLADWFSSSLSSGQ